MVSIEPFLFEANSKYSITLFFNTYWRMKIFNVDMGLEKSDQVNIIIQ